LPILGLAEGSPDLETLLEAEAETNENKVDANGRIRKVRKGKKPKKPVMCQFYSNGSFAWGKHTPFKKTGGKRVPRVPSWKKSNSAAGYKPWRLAKEFRLSFFEEVQYFR